MSFLIQLRNEMIEEQHTIKHGVPIGTITVEDVVTENAHINIDEKKLKNMQVWVYQDEGTLPHFHLISEEKKFFSAIRLDVPEYFLHGKYQDMLNSAEKKALQKFLKKRLRNDPKDISNWEFLRITWNSTSNEKFKVSTITIPDYTELPEKK